MNEIIKWFDGLYDILCLRLCLRSQPASERCLAASQGVIDWESQRQRTGRDTVALVSPKTPPQSEDHAASLRISVQASSHLFWGIIWKQTLSTAAVHNEMGWLTS